MSDIKQIFVARENCPPHYAFWGVPPKVGDRLDDAIVLIIHEQPLNKDQILAVIGRLP